MFCKQFVWIIFIVAPCILCGIAVQLWVKGRAADQIIISAAWVKGRAADQIIISAAVGKGACS